jgi:hypothetical protein
LNPIRTVGTTCKTREIRIFTGYLGHVATGETGLIFWKCVQIVAKQSNSFRELWRTSGEANLSEKLHCSRYLSCVAVDFIDRLDWMPRFDLVSIE